MNAKMNKEKILKTIRQSAKKLRRNPTLRDLAEAGISRHVLFDRCGSLGKALATVGLKAIGAGLPHADSTLLLDWAQVTRKLGKIPSSGEYSKAGCFSLAPFLTRYRHWRCIPQAFAKFVGESRTEHEWQDVLDLIGTNDLTPDEPMKRGKFRRAVRSTVLPGRPIYGESLMLPELAFEPVTESGVIFAFGMVARRLGFVVLRIQTEFPDCEAMRRVARGQLQRVQIEFELESRNFVTHKHDPDGCDVIICWVHNWPECPANIEVVELSKIMREMK
jgi:hypothetical protein